MNPDRSSRSSKPGLYVHIPFCSSICPYCDFAVLTGNRARQERFVSHLLREIELADEKMWGFDTVYFGGGTPSFLYAEGLSEIASTISKKGWLDSDCRWFLEANPEDVAPSSLTVWRELGIRTLSLGVQSLDDQALPWLGRHHTVEDVRRSVGRVREAGFESLSLDLIYGRPGQELADWRKELGAAIALKPDHLSCYQLTIHDRTLFGLRKRKGEVMEASEDAQADLFRLTHELLADAGYEGYEVSNFARSEAHRSRHNQKYWYHTPYLGLGPSAHSFDGGCRFWSERSFFDWQKKIDGGESTVEGRETLSDEELLLEAVMLRMRTKDGLDLAWVRERFDVDFLKLNEEVVAKLAAERLLDVDGDCLRPTLDGLAVADRLAVALNVGPPPA
ncbi:MAG: radical SAM family heme chaperone HemW [Vicinamibacteria bacterium]